MDAAQAFTLAVLRVKDEAGLSDLLAEVCAQLGCSWFALTHHVDFLAAPERGIRIHNYPPDWARWFDDNGLGTTDPIHRESHHRMAGFIWSDVPWRRRERPGDRQIFQRARRHGIGNGLTVPAHLPGEAHGSVSFAWAPGQAASVEALFFATMISGPAFEAARLLAFPELALAPRLTDRQRECLIWAANGKSAWESSHIIGLSRDTVKEHLRNARARYGVHDGMSLAIRALFAGEISFGDFVRR
ncbi:LuxR family transcriptional regulator [Sphingopyxis sp.]|jgi:LuxR family quorum-sensing system transcriptional regulator CciR|uniref:helix-turn-helix transcriptional regulator n=1 Tax=Sphingopyxis sp. TaxID=1908224 RepID=UPI002DE704E1|nr:LuxR family transcriptional regulator [Sphingopyxis sp.]